MGHKWGKLFVTYDTLRKSQQPESLENRALWAVVGYSKTKLLNLYDSFKWIWNPRKHWVLFILL